MPSTREIPTKDWGVFLPTMSKRNQGRPVRLEVTVRPGEGEPLLAEHRPFAGLDLDSKEGSLPRFGAEGDSGGVGAPAITVTLGGLELEMPPFVHWIPNPTHIWVEEEAEGRTLGLSIDTEREGKTLLLFEPEDALPT